MKTIRAKLPDPPMLPKIPYLSMKGWFEALASAFNLRDNTSVGIQRIGQHKETWRNLLDVFGAQEIVDTAHVEEIPVNIEKIPQGVLNPFAMELQCAVVFAAMVGCDMLSIAEDSIRMRGRSASMVFSPGGPFNMVGCYSQENGIPTYGNHEPRAIILGSALSEGTFVYNSDVFRVLFPDSKESLTNHRLIHNFNASRCICRQTIPIEKRQVQGLIIPALALLAADSIPARIFPSEKVRTRETVQNLTFLSTVWRDWEHLTTSFLLESLRLSQGTVCYISKEEFRTVDFVADMIEKRIYKQGRIGLPEWANLGWSWLQPVGEHVGIAHERPRLGPAVGPFDLIIVGGIVELIQAFLNNALDKTRFTVEGKAFLRTRVSYQLQEVDYWLSQYTALAACEACRLLHDLSAWEDNSGIQGTSAETNIDPDEQRRCIRAILVFRSLLMALLLWTALDNSCFTGTELGFKIVLLQ
jgi:hypothetical protein